MKAGDIISVNTIGHVGTYRIVFCYNEEPKTFLVVKPEDNQMPPRCYHILQADCTLVEEGEPPQSPQRTRSRPSPWRTSVVNIPYTGGTE